MMFILVILLLILYISWFYLIKTKKGPNEAAGPTPLPIINNLYHIFKADKIIFLALHKLSLQYGPVYTLFLGPKKYVVVSGMAEVKELMHNPAFDDRASPGNKRIIDEIWSGESQKENPSNYLKHTLFSKLEDLIYFAENLGIIFASGENWKSMRRFTTRALRDHGFGKSTAETFILEEAKYLMEYLKNRLDENNQALVNDFNDIFTMMSLNVVWQMAAGERFNINEPGMTKLLQCLQNINDLLWEISFSPLTVLPFLKNLPPYSKVVEKAYSKMDTLRQFYNETITAHEETFDSNRYINVQFSKKNRKSYNESFLSVSVMSLMHF